MDSLKKYMIASFFSLPRTCDMKSCKIVLVTQAGVIIGSPSEKDEADKAIQGLKDFSAMCSANYRQNHSLDDSQRLEGNDGYLILKDVQFKSGGATYTFNYLNVFFDQIIGVTLFDRQ